MPPSVAAVAFGIGILGLFYLERDSERRTSWALWIPIIWMSIGASRAVSQWLSLSSGVQLDTPDAYLEGSPIDRMVFMLILGAALGVLIYRGRRSTAAMIQNPAVLIFFGYCLLSVAWSDFPFVALKRWSKVAGSLAMTMIILTDPSPREAVKRFLARTGFLLIPVSVLFIKYFPDYGRGYLTWVWTTIYTGVASSKNGLGLNCLIFGLGALWCFLDTATEKSSPSKRRKLLAYAVVFLMVLWLLRRADSATSLLCFVAGAGLMLALYKGFPAWAMHVAVAVVPLSASLLFVTTEADSFLLSFVGRDATLTGRTELWSEVLALQTSPLLGVGFESFWLGPRAQYLWNKIWWHPNQAHNGYIELYLTLGFLGIFALVFLLATGYYQATRTLKHDRLAGALMFTFLLVTVIFNFTEAAFKGIHPLWIPFLLAVYPLAAVPQKTAVSVQATRRKSTSLSVFDTEWVARREHEQSARVTKPAILQ